MMSLDKRGVFCRGELAYEIAALAPWPGFLECLAGLPADLVEEVREIASKPHAHPEDVINGTALYGPMTEEEFEEMQRRNQLHAYWLMRILHGLFYPERPMPVFEPITRVGIVSESAVVDGSVVLFGVLNSFIIRKHPVRCVPPSGEVIITSALPRTYAKELDRYGVFLDATVRSPAEVPPGTEVWVDRTAASDIPPLTASELMGSN
ncbi:hypothetical protein TA3x_003895 [Tundrisphaera sp. TA3]|uniref:hypothetical protein n=1 Tax=Tundrisphaera sp. TA3 TaxID=3435775 RepID=UPI003EBD2333